MKLIDIIADSIHSNLIMEHRWTILADGLGITLYISILSIIGATLVGILFARLRMTGGRRFKEVMKVIIDLIRGIPFVIILMIMFFVVFGSSDISGANTAIISFSIYYGAYFAEEFRNGMNGVGRGQWEAGAAMGLTRFQTFRLVILPQALRLIIPVYKGDAIALIKNTSIVGYIAVEELTYASTLIRAQTMDAFFVLILVSTVYFILSRLASFGLDRLQEAVNSTPNRKTKKK